jgi:nitrogen fixation protein NifB
MSLLTTDHPCFNAEVRHKYARVHLPVAPRCNIQCNYCNRDFDCVNESRPGVTSTLLDPEESLAYLDSLHEKLDNIKVVGIAGPGDPFANPEETMQTMRLIRDKYPEMLICVSTNGLNLEEYIDELAQLNISHITITINAIDPKIAEKIYSYIRYEKRLQKGEEAMKILIDKQLSNIKKLKAKGITVKINSIIIPGVNENHLIEVTKKVKELGADIQNCIPYKKTAGTVFSDLEQPSNQVVAKIRSEIKEIMPQMFHCARCRADAVGLIGEKNDDEIIALIKKAKVIKETTTKDCSKSCSESPEKPCIAIATREGFLINQHLGEASFFNIYKKEGDSYVFLEKREAPISGTGNFRWLKISSLLADCQLLLVNGIGEKPKNILSKSGLGIIVLEGMIDDILSKLAKGESVKYATKVLPTKCGASCSGTGGGCG